MLCYGIHEDYWVTIAGLISGLKVEIECEVSLRSSKSLEKAYHKAWETEKYFPSYPMRRAPFPPTFINFTLIPFISLLKAQLVLPRPNNGLNPSSTSTFKTNLIKCKSNNSCNSCLFASQIDCHHCHPKGCKGCKCPQHTLPLEHEDASLTQEAYEYFQLEPMEDLDYEEEHFKVNEDEEVLSMIQRILSTLIDCDT